MKTQNQMERPTLRKFARQRYQKKIQCAKNLALAAENKLKQGLDFVFPSHVYQQLRKEYGL
jgi:hypothetical protein